MARTRLLLLVVVALLACAQVACGAFIDEEKMTRLRATGAPAEATVVSLESRGVILNRTHHLLRLELDIPVAGDDGGVVLTRVFTDHYVSVVAFPAIQPKSKLAVRYDPRNPSDVYIDFPAMGYR